MARQIITVALNSDSDADLLRWLDRQPNKSEAIREALRDHIGRHSVTVGDVLQAVRDLERKVKAGAVVHGEEEQDGDFDEPPDVAAALDALADL
jgi:Arc/MetJ-type ribon-helix-helix transcriptional regulator